MFGKASIIDDLQKEMDRVQYGLLLSIKLLNKHELNILVKDSNYVLDKFHSIINNACGKIKNCKILKTLDPTKIYIIVAGQSDAGDKIAKSIYSQIKLYVDSKFPEIYLKCSVGGIKFFNYQNIKADQLVSMLMYRISSSQNRGDYYCYEDNPVNIESLRKKNVNLTILRSSLLNKKAKFAYQPIVDRESGKIEYYECLLRILDKDNNLLPVGETIKDAEEKGFIDIVDSHVVDMAVEELCNDKNLNLSINISNIGVSSKQLLQKIERLFKKHDIAKRLIIEITETSLNKDFKQTKYFMCVLHAYGCRFAIDDFGAGFTSFKQFMKLPIDIIKIDGSYIRDILNDDRSKIFVDLLIKLGKDFGIKTVAEFVENGNVARYLIDAKIGGMQGDFFLPASYKRVDQNPA